MLFAFLVVLYVSVAAVDLDTCEVSAKQVESCALELCDFDGNGEISKAEIQFIFDNVLSGVSGIAARLLTSADRVVSKCAGEGSDVITPTSFRDSDSCIDSCFKRRHFYDLVCVPLQDEQYRKTKYAQFHKQQ